MNKFKAFLIFSLAFLVTVQACAAVTSGGITTSPSQVNALKPGDVVSEVAGTINLPTSGGQTFNPDDSLEFYTQLDDARWEVHIVINGIENPARSFAGKHATIGGYDLAYPTDSYQAVALKFSMTAGTVPSSFTSGTINLVRVQELDRSSEQVGAAVYVNGAVVNPAALQTQVDGMRAKLAAFKADIDAKNAMNPPVDVSGAQAKYNEASSAIDSAAVKVSTSPADVAPLLVTAQTDIDAGEAALEQAWADQSLQQAKTMLATVDGFINEFTVSDGIRTTDPRLVPIIDKRDLSAQAISNANDLFSIGSYTSSRGKSVEALSLANQAWELSLNLKAELSNEVSVSPIPPINTQNPTVSTTVLPTTTTTFPIVSVTSVPSVTSASSDSDLVEQLKIQNQLLEEQNRKLSEQSGLLNQIISMFQSFFGMFGLIVPSQSQGTSITPVTTPTSLTVAPAVSPTPHQSRTVTATAIQWNNDIVVMWQGGQDNAMVREYTISITNSGGRTTKGNILQNTIGQSTTFGGVATAGADHVMVNAVFTDGSSQTVLDTYV